ncbi:MAG: hypothetical protein AAAC47_13910 [Pararhizobium sp.]
MPFEVFRTITGEVVRVDVRAIITVGESVKAGCEGQLNIFVRGRHSPYVVKDEAGGPFQTFKRMRKDRGHE